MDTKNTPLYRFFKVVYFLLGIPFWVGLIFWIYISITENVHLEILFLLFVYLIIIVGLRALAKYILTGKFTNLR